MVVRRRSSHMRTVYGCRMLHRMVISSNEVLGTGLELGERREGREKGDAGGERWPDLTR
jgi:hypothetical protein